MAQRSFPNTEKTNGALRPIAAALLYVLVAGVCFFALPMLAESLDLAATYPVAGAQSRLDQFIPHRSFAMSIKVRALHIQRTLGTPRAAAYLRNQGVTIRLALCLLAR